MLTNLKNNVISQLAQTDPDLISLLKIGDLIEGRVFKKNPKAYFWI